MKHAVGLVVCVDRAKACFLMWRSARIAAELLGWELVPRCQDFKAFKILGGGGIYCIKYFNNWHAGSGCNSVKRMYSNIFFMLR